MPKNSFKDQILLEDSKINLILPKNLKIGWGTMIKDSMHQRNSTGRKSIKKKDLTHQTSIS